MNEYYEKQNNNQLKAIKAFNEFVDCFLKADAKLSEHYRT